MARYDYLKNNQNQYRLFALSDNPFTISPLFKEFQDREFCEKEEELFVFPDYIEKETRILLQMKNKRTLIYGLYGVGKTTLVNFFLYLAHNYYRRFGSRIIVTEDNVEHAINEILVTLCFDILSYASAKSILEPIQSFKKWLVEKNYQDSLLRNIAQLLGTYTETEENVSKKSKRTTLQGMPYNVGIGMNWEKEIEIRKSISSYVETLSLKMIARYLESIGEIIRKLGFMDCIIFIDEADHLPKLDKFLAMLTKSREVLFTTGYTFFISGSPELAKYTESMGTVFDKLIFIQPVDWRGFCELLTQRVKIGNKKLELDHIFDMAALRFLFEQSKGLRKYALRMAENAMDIAVARQHAKISKEDCEEVLRQGSDQISSELQTMEVKILQYLARNQGTSPSQKEFLEHVAISRVYLRKLLEQLCQKGYVAKEQKGRKVYYSLLSQYRPYFLEK
jgi:uncharacterized membrane protein